jgi:lysophospholipase L1-like esterase
MPGRRRVLVIGHSFVRRYRQYLERQISNDRSVYSDAYDFSAKLGIPRESVTIIGRSGLLCDSQGASFIKTCVRRVSPKLVILEIGTNDLADYFPFTNAELSDHVAQRVKQLCYYLCRRLHVSTVVLCKVVNRSKLRGGITEEDFKERRHAYNQHLLQHARAHKSVYVFQHDRSTLVNLKGLSEDHIHVTSTRGLDLYHFSIRRAIVRGLAHMEAHTSR